MRGKVSAASERCSQDSVVGERKATAPAAGGDVRRRASLIVSSAYAWRKLEGARI